MAQAHQPADKSNGGIPRESWITSVGTVRNTDLIASGKWASECEYSCMDPGMKETLLGLSHIVQHLFGSLQWPSFWIDFFIFL